MVSGRCVDNRVFLDYRPIVGRVGMDVGVSFMSDGEPSCQNVGLRLATIW